MCDIATVYIAWVVYGDLLSNSYISASIYTSVIYDSYKFIAA